MTASEIYDGLFPVFLVPTVIYMSFLFNRVPRINVLPLKFPQTLLLLYFKLTYL
jgi:hypothetical protein